MKHAVQMGVKPASLPQRAEQSLAHCSLNKMGSGCAVIAQACPTLHTEAMHNATAMRTRLLYMTYFCLFIH